MHKLFFDAALTPAGWRNDVLVQFAGDRIASVASEVGAVGRGGAELVGGIALPGTGNLHSHTFQRGFAGLTERRGEHGDHFWTWREEMYRFSGRLSPDDVQAVAAMAFIEMLESGFTSVAEFHYLHHQPDGRPYDEPAELAARIAGAAGETGIGLTLLPVFYAHGGFGRAAPAPGQRRFVSSLDLYARIVDGARRAVDALPGGRVGIAPHSLRAVSPEQLAALEAAFPRGPIHIHVAEQIREVEECLAATGQRPVGWLLDNAPVDSRWCLVHATHMTEDETFRLARSGATAGLCPITESDLGDGIFPATTFTSAAGTFGVGSDSNVLISLPAELRCLEYSQRLRDRARNRLASPGGSVGRHLFEAVGVGGARALGMPQPTIHPGSRADIVVLDPDDAALMTRSGDAVLDSWIFAARGPAIRNVYAAGKLLVQNGRHIAREAVQSSFRRTLERMME